MRAHLIAAGMAGCGLMLLQGGACAQQSAHPQTPIEYIHAEGQYTIPVPLTPAVKAGNLLFVSGIPAFDKNGKLAVNDFTAQMNQVMENITGILKAAGVGWDRVVKVNVFLARREDFKEMNRIFAAHFQPGKYPTRTTAVTPLPNPDFLLEIECVAALD
ncbi:RidA family protein [Ralstonia solanacearum]|uniref:RidA family protein n=1 Tax=Ralstonia solanacearum TaxID=305 RepID=UPI0018CFF377|nr:RidA family protein [Ralstonia solanacearum]